MRLKLSIALILLCILTSTNCFAAGLSGTKSAQPSSVTLSSEGTSDWAHWGLNSATDFNHKSGVTSQISNFTKIGTATVHRYTDGTMAASWTGGTPSASATSSRAGIYIAGVGNGFQITVPADTSTKTLKVYCGLWKSRGKLEAFLSDNSAPAFLDTSHESTTGSFNTLFTLNFSAASAGQKLTVKWSVEVSHDTAGAGTVGWQCATLSGSTSSNPAPTVSLTSPANGATFTAPASISLGASASDSGGSVSRVEFFAGSSLLSSDTTSPYAYTWSSVAAGAYSLSARATDNGGAMTTSAAVNVNVTGSTSAEVHPRLWITQTRLNQIKNAITVSGSAHNEMYNAMKSRADLNDWKVYDEVTTDNNWNYARTWLARESAFLYLLTGNATYASNAYNALRQCYDQSDPDKRWPDGGYSFADNYDVSRAMMSVGFAVTYDWCYNGWTATQRTWVKDKIISSLNNWPNVTHVNVTDTQPVSNHAAVCRSAETVTMLAGYQEVSRSARFSNLKKWLNDHMTFTYGAGGYTQEGVAYADYAGSFMVPAVLALRSIGDTTLDAQFNAKNWYRLNMFVGGFDAKRTQLMTGVDTSGVSTDEGWTSALLGTVPSTTLPQYLYWYDRYIGKLSPAPAKYDNRRAGTTWAMIYYPETATASNPGTSSTFADEQKGAYYFRNRWQDANDIFACFMGDFAPSYDHAWNQAEAFQIGLVGYGTRWICGPEKAGVTTAIYSALIVDGKPGISDDDTGTKEFYSASATGGYAIVAGGTKYTNLGLDSAKRHFLADFSGKMAPGMISTMDRVADSTSHTLVWQANIGDQPGNGGITVTNGTESGRPYFLLKNASNAFVKGWVLTPSTATVTSGDPLKISTSGSVVDIWTVMVIGSGTPPVASITGTGLSTQITVGTGSVRFDSVANRIVAQ